MILQLATGTAQSSANMNTLEESFTGPAVLVESFGSWIILKSNGIWRRVGCITDSERFQREVEF